MIFNKKRKNRRIYLDYASTTPCDKGALRAMERFWRKDFGNAGSLHREGVVAKKALDDARSDIAKTIQAHSDEIIFTSSGTESNNLAILGYVRKLEKGGMNRVDMHIVTSTIEHPSVREVFSVLEKTGVKVSYVDVDESGSVNPADVYDVLTSQTVLVSIMYVNNEIGTIQPIVKIARKIRRFVEENSTSKSRSLIFHTDASQAPLYLNCSVDRLGVDLMTVDAQKIYGPKGVGFLYKRRGVPITPLLIGGHQEYGIRSSTENIPLIVGLAHAFVSANCRREHDTKQVTTLRDYFIEKVLRKISDVELNGDRKERISNNINISIKGVEAEYIALVLDSCGIAVGTRSACASKEDRSSYVIRALGKNDVHARGALRFSLGRNTTKRDLDYTIKVLVEKVTLHRKKSILS